MSRATQKGSHVGRMNHRKRVLQVSMAWWLLWPACLWGQPQPLRQPVGSDLLRAGELIVESCNFAVATPAGEWQWSVIENPRAARSQSTYVCTETASGAELFVTVTDARMSSGSRFVDGFKDGLKESLTASGLTIVSIDMAESSIPLPGSYHCQWQVQCRDGTSVYGYSYVTGGAVTYVLQHATTETSEPLEFTQFAHTFRLLHASRPRPQTGSGSLLVGYLLLVGLACMVAWVINRISARAILNGGTLGAALIVVAMLALIGIGSHSGISAGLPPEKLGRIAGQRVGEALIALLLAVLASHRFRKRRRRQEGRPRDAQAAEGEEARQT